MFRTLLISGFSLMHLHVCWRGAGVPVVKRCISRKGFLAVAVILWVGGVLAMSFGHGAPGFAAVTLERLSLHWLAVVFVCSVCLLVVDLLTLFGRLLPRHAPVLRGWALATGGLLSIVAWVQGSRPPVVQSYELPLPGLPPEKDGIVLVALSDLHLGSILGAQWLAERVAQVQAERPDTVVLLGDVFEGHGQPADELLPVLRQLSAPLGVWAVTGNHESHGGGESGVRLLEQAGISVLRDRWIEALPGLVIAGVDERTLQERHKDGNPVAAALAGRPPGAVVLLSHRPPRAKQVEEAGVALALCGHTHAGQIWPFGYVVRAANSFLEGAYRVRNGTLIVCRGTGTWGPRMRLWRPSEILRVTLRAGPPDSRPAAVARTGGGMRQSALAEMQDENARLQMTPESTRRPRVLVSCQVVREVLPGDEVTVHPELAIMTEGDSPADGKSHEPTERRQR